MGSKSMLWVRGIILPKKKEKRAAKVVLFNSAMALCFARLSLKTLSFVVAREGKGAALFRTTRVIIFRV